MQFAIESWAPEYGVAADGSQLDEVDNVVDIDVEVPADDWVPITPSPEQQPERLLFVDGVRRIDARVWFADGDLTRNGVCASVAAGSVVCTPGAARVDTVAVRRGFFALSAPTAGPIVTGHGTYRYVPCPADTPEDLYLAIHAQMTSLEATVAHEHDAELVVFDGPLRGRNDPAAVGYVKTQHVQYLPDAQQRVLGRLGDGQRTPVFLIGGRGFTRYSWYLRLPGPRAQPLSGVVRCEIVGLGAAAAAVARADQVSAVLPRFASAPHKDPRAPQNLYPIAGLEQQLRHRLGDQLFLERALRRAAGQPSPTSPSVSASAAGTAVMSDDRGNR